MDKDLSITFKEFVIIGGLLSIMSFLLIVGVWFTMFDILEKLSVVGAGLIIIVGYTGIVHRKYKRR